MNKNELIERIDISHIDIEHELSDRGLAYLRTAGNNLKAHCVSPNHKDSTPSAVISLREGEKYGLWYCNGCGASGNFFHLVSYLDGVSYSDAIGQFFGDVTNVDFLLKTAISFLKKRLNASDKIVYKIINTAKYAALKRPNGISLAYLKGPKRKLTEETIEYFDLRISEKGEYKKRVLIPYFDSEGRILTLKARSWLPDDKKRIKMLTWKNTEPKPSLFGMFDNYGLMVRKYEWPKKENEVILVEGEFDAMWMQQCGYRAYGLGSTSISKKQLGSLIRNFDKVFIALDGDMFDTEEKRRVLDRIVKKISQYAHAVIIKLPKDKDPNSMSPGDLAEVFQPFFP